ncbi:ketosteroid isomerase [Devosia sp. Root413D1]|uniref:nuclear transport factor 2 family protein n=1 Tax=Devosia sp. Root413D1 TaxID=1736531 RepID=UPI0006F7204C|nr:nuclear transport factor 2 family protein [Devosia sp. Root413D1]KQW73959.1 ketosteroid isomerase [Devosia sp. Root413D1]
MSTTPPVIQRFIAATNAGDTAAFLEAFTPDAFLSDWGRDFTGRDGIASWNETDNIGVQSKFRLLEVEPSGADAYRVRLAVSGNGYNGEGTMAFTLTGGRISRLVIS